MSPVVIGLDLSLTGAAGVALDPQWTPGDWGALRTTVVGFSVSRDAGAAERIARLRDIAACITEFAAGGRSVGKIAAFVEDYSYGMAFGAHQLGEVGGVVKLAFYNTGIVLRALNHARARKFLIGVGKAKGIKKEVHRRLKEAGAPFESGDVMDAFVIANAGRAELGLPAMTLAPPDPGVRSRRRK